MNATAAVLREARAEFALEPIELAAPRAEELLVRIVGCGVCHSDLLTRTLPEGSIRLPMIFGHEGAGVVEAVGAEVKTITVGDHVVLSFDSCGRCSQCLSGHPAYCAEWLTRNFDGLYPDKTSSARDASGATLANRWFAQSSFATRSLVSVRGAVKVDPSLPLELLGPLGCGVMTGVGTVLRALRVPPGAAIAVFGAGAVGLSAIMAAKLAGAAEIVAVDVKPGRLELARELGATYVLDGSDPDRVERWISDGAQVGFALDTTALPAVAGAAIRSLAVGGTAALVGVGYPEIAVDPASLAGRSLRYVSMGDSLPQTFIPQLIGFWRRGQLPFDKLVRTYPLEKVNHAAADSLRGETVKPVLLMTGVTP